MVRVQFGHELVSECVFCLVCQWSEVNMCVCRGDQRVSAEFNVFCETTSEPQKQL
jgi:hypothetical protein